MVTNMYSDHVYQFAGLSTDKKPIGINCTDPATIALYDQKQYIIDNGSTMLEMDTKSVYILKLTEESTGVAGTWVKL